MFYHGLKLSFTPNKENERNNQTNYLYHENSQQHAYCLNLVWVLVLLGDIRDLSAISSKIIFSEGMEMAEFLGITLRLTLLIKTIVDTHISASDHQCTFL